MSSQIQTIRESFFNTVFSLLGHIANCDGYINRNEIKRIETYMEKMSLSEKCKREAQHLFREGSSPRFNMSQVLRDFSKNSTPNLIQILLVYLISMARTDGLLVKKEMQVVQQVARELGFASIVFDHLLKMISAQDDFSSTTHQFTGTAKKDSTTRDQQRETPRKDAPNTDNSHSDNKSSRQDSNRQKDQWKTHSYETFNKTNNLMDEAYEALGAKASMTEAEIKKAYQRLASQFHPDKLVGQGMPPDLIATATERFKKIQAAYDYIKKHRRINAVA